MEENKSYNYSKEPEPNQWNKSSTFDNLSDLAHWVKDSKGAIFLSSPSSERRIPKKDPLYTCVWCGYTSGNEAEVDEHEEGHFDD